MKNYLNKKLNKFKNVENIHFAFKLIIKEALQIDDVKYYQNDYQISFLKFLKINFMLNSFIYGKPLNYVLKYKIILEKKFFINKNVLIPRNETEELISESIKIINDYFDIDYKKTIFDICTGSLVIATCLLHSINNCNVYASDISKKALKVAKKNNRILNNNKINIIRTDILNYYIKNNLKCDVLICNPPYIDKNSKEYIYNSEPKIALFAKEKGLFFYREILSNINKIVNKKSLIIFEIGYDQMQDITSLIEKFLPNKKFIINKDINNL